MFTALLVVHGDGILDDEDLSLVCLGLDENETDTPIGGRLGISSLTELRCRERFQFSRDQLVFLCHALRLPMEMEAVNKTHWQNLEVLCIVLRRLSYPGS